MSSHRPSEYPPGSINAVEAGCVCGRLDNNHGAGCGNGLFVTRADCPLHGDDLARYSAANGIVIDREDEYLSDERAGIEDERLAEID